ncbi:MAG TPA: CBS domain-containing protein, partial [Aeromicrobium sp.]|nr:CBS domain-containing protein [Aeromicrobium sp.]
ILNDPANDYVAQFVQDVDRTRILTAASVMELPVAVLGSELGPRVAHKLMRENQVSSLFVVGRDKSLRGLVYESEVAGAVRERSDKIDNILHSELFTVGPETSLADLFIDSAKHTTPLPVVDDNGRLLGVIPRVTLLNALGNPAVQTEPKAVSK